MPIETSFVACNTGWLHRPKAEACPSFLPRDQGSPSTPKPEDECARDEDCTARPHGYCGAAQYSQLSPASYRACHYGCTQDSDCGEGLCVCSYPVGECTSHRDCRVDADCASGLCVGVRTAASACGESFYQFACHSPNDACPATASCGSGGACLWAADGRYCENIGICGRPFLVDGVARLATAAVGRGWASDDSVALAALTDIERQRLAAHYERNALMEHASVAAFARFALELLAFGAPAELLRETQRAMADEIRHAELCFGLASEYAGHAVAPGPLSVNGAVTTPELETALLTAFLEACIGETQAAAEATAALLGATEPAVVAALGQIAEDERRHAELGWRFVQWALTRLSAPRRVALSQRLVQEVRIALERASEPLSPVGSAAEMAHGLLAPATLQEARYAALAEVCLPCAEALAYPALQVAC
ncbi:MAG TPA: ferritin-like domain-containing protein [Polyangiaceae bacterium]|nr:ferritin-like domain-containing protein [Polyangiaceae bacterium]